MTVSILDLFKPEEILREKSDGNYLVRCPSCGSDTSNYGDMVLFIKTDTAYCFGSMKWFTLKETYALKKGIINCNEGRDSK